MLFILFAFFYAYKLTRTFPLNIYVLAVVSGIILSIQISRKDKLFLMHISTKTYLLFFAEYVFFSAPVSVMVLISGTWYWIFGFMAILFLISLIQYTPKTTKGFIPWSKVIPSWNFEWISGLRRYGFLMIILYIASLCLVKFYYASLFLVWFMLIVIAEFYAHAESVQILCSHEKNSRKFLQVKIKTHIFFFLSVFFPVWSLYLIFHFEQWPVVAFFIITSMINFLYLILTKYSLYEPGIKITGNEVQKPLVLLSALIPFLLPLPLFFVIRNFYRARNNLNIYLNAFDK